MSSKSSYICRGIWPVISEKGKISFFLVAAINKVAALFYAGHRDNCHMTLLDQIDWCETPLVGPTPNSATEEEVARHLGFSMTILSYISPVPWVAWSFAHKIQPVIHLSKKLSDLIELVVSMENSCRYCYGTVRSILSLTGYSEKQIIQLEEDLYRAELSGAEKKMLSFARKCARSDPRPDFRDLEALEAAGFSRFEIAEAAFVITSTCYSNRVGTLLGVPPDDFESLAANRFIRLAKPVFSFFTDLMLGRAKKRNIRKYQPANGVFNNAGLGAKIVEALEGTPSAYVLRTILDEAWESPVCTKRTKALIFAVIAQTLECKVCTSEACSLLENEGLQKEDIDQLLTYLHSEKLNSFELKLVDFARDTVHYQVPAIQSKVNEFTAGLKKEETIEIIALTGLANWVARLSIILRQHN